MMASNWIKITLYGSFVLFLAACSQVGAPTLPDETLPQPTATLPIVDAQTTPEKNGPQMTQVSPFSGMEFLIGKAKEDLAQRLSIPVTQISLIDVTEAEWSDSGLGCPQPDMMYAQVVTPGYQIILEAAGEPYEYHTDADRFLVMCEKEGDSEVIPRKVPTILSEEIVTTPVNGELLNLIDTAKKDLARRLEIIPDEIEVLRIEKAEWPDTSLGCAKPGLARRPVAIPGYRIVLSSMGREYVYHTDRKSGVVFCPKG